LNFSLSSRLVQPKLDCDSLMAALSRMSWNETLVGQGASPLIVAGVLLTAYGLGCFATGYYLVRTRTGLDVRESGTGSTGARNVGRMIGSNGFILTMAGDVAKGGLAVWLALAFTGNERLAALALLAVVAGHVWPAQLGFQGGKGVATSLAGLLIYDSRLVLALLGLFAAGLVVTRRSVGAGLMAFATLPAAGFWMGEDQWHLWTISTLAGLVVLAHYRNMTQGISDFMLRRGCVSEANSSVKEI
jgi:glycerol-3-phosphate acyltransferase PlsY